MCRAARSGLCRRTSCCSCSRFSSSSGGWSSSRLPEAPRGDRRVAHVRQDLASPRAAVPTLEAQRRQIPHGASRGLVQASLHLTSLSPAQGYDTSECIGTHAWHLSVWRCGQRLNRRTGFEPVLLPSETAGYPWRGELYPHKRRCTRKGHDPWSLLLT